MLAINSSWRRRCSAPTSPASPRPRLQPARLRPHRGRHRLCRRRAAGGRADDPHRQRRPDGRRGHDPGRRLQDAGLSRDAGRQERPAGGAGRAARSSACTSTSPTSRGASPSSATWRSRPSCSCARAMRSRTAKSRKLMSEVVSKVPDAQVMGDLDACVAWAGANGGDAAQARHHRLLLGRAHRLAVRRAQPAAEGRRGLVRPRWSATPTPLTPKQPIDLRRRAEGAGAGPLRRQGPGHPARHRRADEGGARRRQRGSKSEFVVYPEAPHAFHADYRPSYVKEAAEDGWKRAWPGSRRTA